MDEFLARFATRQEKLAKQTRYVADDLSGEARLREFVERFSHDRVAACRFLISSLLDPLATVKGRSRWVEMTPENIAAAPFLLAMYPQAKFVHTVRDGRDVAVSRRHKRAPDTPIAHWVEHWEDALRRAHRGSRYVTSDRLLVLRFEDLVSRDRQATLRRMMEFLQVGESEAVERFFETEMPASRANVGRWQRDLDDAEQRQVQVAYVRALGRLRRDEIACAPAGDDDDDAVRILHAEAAEHLRAALSALSDVSPSVRPDRGWLLATLAEAERDAGDWGKARAHYLEAAQIARDQHDPLALTAVALGLTGGRPKPWTFPDPDATATALLGEALDGLSTTPTELAARVHARQATYMMGPGDTKRRSVIARRAMQIADSACDGDAFLDVAEEATWSLAATQAVDDRLRCAASFLDAARGASAFGFTVRALHALYAVLIEAGEPGEGEAVLLELEGMADRTTDPRTRWLALALRAGALFARGDIDHAVQHSRAAGRLGRARVIPAWRTVELGHEVVRALVEPSYASPVGGLIAATKEQPLHALWPAALAVFRAREGNTKLAGILVDEAMDRLERREGDDRAAAQCLVATAADIAGGHPRVDTGLFRQLAESADHVVVLMSGTVQLGSVELYLGAIAEAMGRKQRARIHLERARERNAAIGAHAFEALADAALDARRPVPATSDLVTGPRVDDGTGAPKSDAVTAPTHHATAGVADRSPITPKGVADGPDAAIAVESAEAGETHGQA